MKPKGPFAVTAGTDTKELLRGTLKFSPVRSAYVQGFVFNKELPSLSFLSY